jgi:tetratricopeptide (TPR) repeat protein
MNNVAETLSKLKRHDESLDLFKRALEKRLRILGEENEDTIRTFNRVANQLVYLRRFDEALEMHEKALDLNSRFYGEEHRETLRSMYNVAYCLYHDFQRDDEAHQIASKCFLLAQKTGDEECAAKCVELLSDIEVGDDDVEETHIEVMIRLRKEAKEIEAKEEAARIADLPPPMTDDDIDKLIANLGFDGNEGKKKNARGTANEGGSKKQGKKGGRGRK